METTYYLIKILGWTGTGLFLFAYWQLNRGHWTARTPVYHWLNILGGIFLVIDTAYDQSWAALAANGAWGIIAVLGLLGGKPANQQPDEWSGEH